MGTIIMQEIKNRDLLNRSQSRRGFLRNSSLTATSFLVFPRYVLGGASFTPPSEKLNVAIIGTGGRGIDNMKELIRQKDVQIIALCDVSEDADYSRFYYGGRAGRGPAKEILDLRYSSDPATADYPECSVHIDFRKMFE